MQRTAAMVRSRVEAMMARCRDAGLNVTPQRTAVYRALLESEEHPTPELLFERVKRDMPAVSLATIYKALEALQSLGLVRAVPFVGDKRRFDANDSPHHHLVCERCGSIRDYYDHGFDALVPGHRVRGFTAHSISVNITGICSKCSNKRR